MTSSLVRPPVDPANTAVPAAATAQPLDPAGERAPSARRTVVLAVAVAVVAGLVLGDADLLLQAALPYPWANLANSSAVWALAAFGYGAWTRRATVTTAVGGAVLLVVAVATYYLTAAAVLDNDLAMLWTPTAVWWALFGVVAGALFATAGAFCRQPGWLRPVGAAAAAAVCWAEAAVVALRAASATGDARTDLTSTVAITVVLGALVLVAAARSVRTVGWAALLALPLALIGFVGFAAAGFVEPGLIGALL